MSKLDLYQQFRNYLLLRNQIEIGYQLSAILDYMEYSIIKLFHPSEK